MNQHGAGLPKSFPLTFDAQTHANRDYRKATYRSTAANTFKAFLYKQIPEDDLKINGKWIDSTTESEVMFSCLEMCGQDKIGIIREPIYIYNQHRKGSTLKRKYKLNGKIVSGKEYKYHLYNQIIARPKRDKLTRVIA